MRVDEAGVKIGVVIVAFEKITGKGIVAVGVRRSHLEAVDAQVRGVHGPPAH